MGRFKPYCELIMSRHSSELADNLRKEIMFIILSAWKDNTAFSFTSDMYRSKNLLLFMGLMVHFLDKDFNLRKFVLHADYFGERRHTAENILMALDTFMKEASLDGPDVTFIILLDNASNNKQAMSLGAGDYNSLVCNPHLTAEYRRSIKDKAWSSESLESCCSM